MQSPRLRTKASMTPAKLAIFFGIAAIPFFVSPAAAGKTVVLEDFDEGTPLGDAWTVSGEIKATRSPLPVKAPDAAGETGPSGEALHIVAGGKFALHTKEFTPESARWQDAESIAFWIYQADDRESRIDFLAMEHDRKAVFWRKCTFSGAGWQRVELPLRWFRWEPSRLPRWPEIAHFGIRGGSDLDFWIDRVELVDADPKSGSEYTVEELIEVAFPRAAPESLKTVADDRAWVLSNAPDLDAEELHAHLIEVRATLERDIPSWKRKGDGFLPPRILIFKDKESYAGFFDRLGEKLLGTVRPPRADGYHVQGIAASYYDGEWGTIRPVFTHEFVHSIATFLGLHGSSGGDWFQEGLANSYQLKFHPQQGISRIIAQGLENEPFRSSLSSLASGIPIPTNRYWQAMSLFDFLHQSDATGQQFPILLKQMEATGSVDLRKHLGPVYGITLGELESAWMSHAKENLEKYEPSTDGEEKRGSSDETD